MKTKNLFWLWVSIFVVAVDQITKYLALTHLSYLDPVHIFPLVNLTLDLNSGAAFSLLSHASGWQRWFFIDFTLIVVAILIVWLLKTEKSDWLQKISLSLIIGGALGNLIDRIINGRVIDFIDVFYNQHHWPIFNIADSAITVGVILLFF